MGFGKRIPVVYKIYHQIKQTGKWRVTDAPDDWRDDGRDYPEAKSTDKYFETEEEARRYCKEQNYPPTPDDPS